MKNKCLIILLLCCTAARSQLYLGIKGGITLPSLESNTHLSGSPNNHQGIYAGISADLRITNLLMLQGEINFTQQGGQRNGIQPIPNSILQQNGLPTDVSFFANYNSYSLLDYIEIPLLIKLSIGRKLKYYSCAGPYISFLTGARKNVEGTSAVYLDEAATLAVNEYGVPYATVILNSTADIHQSIRTINMGFQGGVGIEYAAFNGSIFLESRVVIGLTNINTNPSIYGSQQTGSFVAAMGYRWWLK